MAFFDTDTGTSYVDTIHRYTHRWSTEITNRETKSLLDSSDSQCRSETSVSPYSTDSVLELFSARCLVPEPVPVGERPSGPASALVYQNEKHSRALHERIWFSQKAKL